MRKLLKWVLSVMATIAIALFLIAFFIVYIAPLLRDRTTQCGDISRTKVKEEILSYATKPGRFKHINKDYDGIEPSGDVAYSDAARVWDQTVFIKNGRKRLAKSNIMLACDGGIELATDPDFIPD